MKKLIKGIFKLGAYIGAFFGAYRLFSKYNVKPSQAQETTAQDDLEDFELDEDRKD